MTFVVNPIIVIPVHREQMTVAQESSLSQLNGVLGDFTISLVAPVGLNVSAYRRIIPKLELTVFDPYFFSDFRAHQRLMISEEFYKRFEVYSHLLVYHLDAWVFKNELLQWCEAGYDYIGAAWRAGYDEKGNPIFKTAGNGGFSLRNVQACLKTIRSFDGRRHKGLNALLAEAYYRVGLSRMVHCLMLPLKLLGIKNNLRLYYKTFAYTEDKFWAKSAALANPEFKVAPVDIAHHFAFEASPGYLFKQRGSNLPFGCHAWRYEQDFWCGKIGLPQDLDFKPHDNDGKPICKL